MARDSRDAKPTQRGDGLGLLQNPLRFWFNTGPPGDGVSRANRSQRSGHAAVRRGVDGVETLRDALASEKADTRRDVNVPRGWLARDAGLGCRVGQRPAAKRNCAERGCRMTRIDVSGWSEARGWLFPLGGRAPPSGSAGSAAGE